MTQPPHIILPLNNAPIEYVLFFYIWKLFVLNYSRQYVILKTNKN